MKVTILGCGASSGSPLIGEEMPSNPKNIRSRASIFIKGESTNILIDTSPDFRQQAENGAADGSKRVHVAMYIRGTRRLKRFFPRDRFTSRFLSPHFGRIDMHAP